MQLINFLQPGNTARSGILRPVGLLASYGTLNEIALIPDPSSYLNPPVDSCDEPSFKNVANILTDKNLNMVCRISWEGCLLRRKLTPA